MKSKRVLTWAAVVLLAVLSTLPAADPAAAQNRPGSSQGKPEFVADELLVAFKAGTPADRRAAAHSQAGGQVVRHASGASMSASIFPPYGSTLCNAH